MQNNDKCKKPLFRLISALNKIDNRTIYCSNISKIAKECKINKDQISPIIVKNKLIYFKIPTTEEWRIDLMYNLIYARIGEFTVENFVDDELNYLLELVCSS